MVNIRNILLLTDSYKPGHWPMYPEETEVVFSYGEARVGGKFDFTLWYGLQSILLEYLVGQVVTEEKIQEAKAIYAEHFDDGTVFNEAGWRYILEKHNGKLPIRIRSAPEGLRVPIGNVLFTIENTDDKCPWLTNYLESLMLHVWYSSTVATLSRSVKDDIEKALATTSDLPPEIQKIIASFMLHDFGFRGVSSVESSEIGGSAHLVNFNGTDTVPAIKFIEKNYGGDGVRYGKSVRATEHSIMTARGEANEFEHLEFIIKQCMTGVLSVVGDSYSIIRFVDEYIRKLKDLILSRQPNAAGICKFVLRPDSLRYASDTPEEQMVYLWERMANIFGYTTNSKGYKVLNPMVGLIWGDGIDAKGIKKILDLFVKEKICVSAIVFGMGGGLLQKTNRDDGRWATKSSAQKRKGKWYNVVKKPLDTSKNSKPGLLTLQKNVDGKLVTISYGDDREAYEDAIASGLDYLKDVFFNGDILKLYKFSEVRANSELVM